jgi:hypothetical protein
VLQHKVKWLQGISSVLFILIAGILFSRCSSVGNSLTDPGNPFYLHTLPPSPTPGMAVILNLNAGGHSNVRRDVEIVGVFQGWFSETDLVGVDSAGKVSVKMGCIGFLREGNRLFAKETLVGIQEEALTWSFVLPGGLAGPTGIALFLPPRRAQYTLLVRYKDMYGRYIAIYGKGEEAIRFRTTGYSFESQTIQYSPWQQAVTGDPIVRLPLIDAKYPPLSLQYTISTTEMVKLAIMRMIQKEPQIP